MDQIKSRSESGKCDNNDHVLCDDDARLFAPRQFQSRRGGQYAPSYSLTSTSSDLRATHTSGAAVNQLTLGLSL
jgi:hypothetical protein